MRQEIENRDNISLTTFCKYVFPATIFTTLTTAQQPDSNIFYTELYPTGQEIWSLIIETPLHLQAK
jgi:hypothetical protein